MPLIGERCPTCARPYGTGELKAYGTACNGTFDDGAGMMSSMNAVCPHDWQTAEGEKEEQN
jgi:hypothetical protein